MQVEQEISVRLKPSGEVDTAYYIAQAKQQRGEVVAASLKTLSKVLKRLLSSSRSDRQRAPAYTC
ncbi:RSP_7527 family protein [uncultured Neptuniibacter sp.]|uniref:RSP_7527 family protein n=1 Tax=uncultured Neptuniibacter sp. TaxID=502143 RepID=UPI002636A349|nr:hypothetical protein [uncultured Neptuniibacter sp.]